MQQTESPRVFTPPLPLPLPPKNREKTKPNAHVCYQCPTEYLEAYGFKAKRIHPAKLLLTAVVGLIIVIGSIKGTTLVRDQFQFIAALGALALTYQQWRESRHEISMDKYY